MQDIFLALIGQLNSSVFVLLGILVIVFIVLFKVGYWTHKFASHDKRVENIEGLAEKVVALSTKVDLIYQFVNPNAPTRAHSPISLTKVGDEIVRNIGAEQLLKKYADDFCAAIEQSNPRNAYDIQQASFAFAKGKMINLLNEDELMKVKQEAFNRGILVEDVMSVFGVLLRNHLLAKKGMSIAEVDQHMPTSAK